MNLKEAFRYQNKLQSLMDEAQGILDRDANVTKVENTYLAQVPSEDRRRIFDALLAYEVPALIITRGLDPFPELMEMADKHDRTILRTQETTTAFMGALIAGLRNELAPRITRHGVLVEVYGEGVLLLGESGVGKSGATAWWPTTPWRSSGWGSTAWWAPRRSSSATTSSCGASAWWTCSSSSACPPSVRTRTSTWW